MSDLEASQVKVKIEAIEDESKNKEIILPKNAEDLTRLKIKVYNMEMDGPRQIQVKVYNMEMDEPKQLRVKVYCTEESK